MKSAFEGRMDILSHKEIQKKGGKRIYEGKINGWFIWKVRPIPAVSRKSAVSIRGLKLSLSG